MSFIPGFSHISQEGFEVSVLRCYVVSVIRWQMPLLFFIAGVSACVSLTVRSPKTFIKERVKRLLVPLIFFMIVCFPVLLYFWPGICESKSLSDYLGRFWPRCIMTLHDCRIPGRDPAPGWAHLWFVAYLLLYSFIALPLFLHLRRREDSGLADKFLPLCKKKGGILLMGIPLIVINMALTPKWPMGQVNLYTDWAYFCYNLTVFVYGYIICLHDTLWETIDQHLKISLPLAFISTALVLLMRVKKPEFSTEAYTLKYMLY